MSYQVPQHIDHSNVFLVNLSELEGRLDPIFYGANFTKFFKHPRSIRLKDVCLNFSSGFGAGKDEQTIAENGYIQIRPTNIDCDGFLRFDKNVYVPFQQRASFVKRNTVLFNNTNSQELVGKTAIVLNDSQLYTSNHITSIIVNESAIKAEYLWIILNIYQRNNVFYSICTNWNNQSGVGVDLLQSIRIPVLSVEDQDEIVNLYSSAYNKKHQKEQQAEALLHSIDDYLLDELDIQLPEMKSPTLQDRMFVVNFSYASGERLDPMFYTSQFSNIVAKLHDTTICKRLGQIAHFSTEVWNQKDYYEKEFPYIEIGAINIPHGKIEDVSLIPVEQAPSRARVIVRTGDIIISTTRPDRGAIIKISENENLYIASTGFSVIRDVDSDINPDYLLAILRHKLILMQMRQRSTGGNYPAITQEELSKIIIPILPLSKQKEIVEHISAIRKQAKALQEEGKTILEQAKKEVEQMILGN